MFNTNFTIFAINLSCTLAPYGVRYQSTKTVQSTYINVISANSTADKATVGVFCHTCSIGLKATLIYDKYTLLLTMRFYWILFAGSSEEESAAIRMRFPTKIPVSVHNTPPKKEIPQN